MTKEQFKSIRLVLGLSQREYAEILNVSKAHVEKSEGTWRTGYEVSGKLESKVTSLIEDMGLSLDDIYAHAKKAGYLK